MKSISSILAIIALALALFVLCSCGINQPLGTQIPPAVHSSTASFDGREQNSGILGEDAGLFHVTPHFHDRFTAMASTYGQRLTPPLDTTRGVTALPDGTYTFDAEAMASFLRMNRWRREPATPAPSLIKKLL